MKTGWKLLATITVVVMALVTVACGEAQRVGSEQLLEFEEQKGGGPRLGERTAPPKQTPSSLTVAEKTPTPTPKPSATPKPSYFDVTLTADSPYYKPGNRIIIRAGVTLRVTNKDATPERSKGRSFTDKHGAFHSGLLKNGQSWTHTFEQPAGYEIVDQGLNFATAILEVVS